MFARMRMFCVRGHFKVFTLPEWRGKGLHASNVASVLEKFRKQPGFKGLVTLVLGTNYSSLASFERLGFKRARRFHFLRYESTTPWILGSVQTAGHYFEKVNK